MDCRFELGSCPNVDGRLVRDQAFKAMDMFVKRLEAHAASMVRLIQSLSTSEDISNLHILFLKLAARDGDSRGYQPFNHILGTIRAKCPREHCIGCRGCIGWVGYVIPQPDSMSHLLRLLSITALANKKQPKFKPSW